MGKKKEVENSQDNDSIEEESFQQKKKKKKTTKKTQKIEKVDNNGSEKKEAKAKQQKQVKTVSKTNKKSQDTKAKVEQKEDKRKDYLPGQKYPTPDDEDGACAFYKSLYEKNPRSQMAKKYCLEYGVLQPQEAQKLFKQMGRGRK